MAVEVGYEQDMADPEQVERFEGGRDVAPETGLVRNKSVLSTVVLVPVAISWKDLGLENDGLATTGEELGGPIEVLHNSQQRALGTLHVWGGYNSENRRVNHER